MDIKIRVIKLGRLFVAMTRLGGIDIRGGTRESDIEATQSLFAVLAGTSGNNDDALLAVSLALEGSDLEHAKLTSSQVEHDDEPR